MVHAALFLTVASAAFQGQAESAVSGVVHTYEAQQRVTLGAAMVEIASPEDGRRVFTVYADSLGVYTIRNVPPGRWKITAFHVGYEPFTTLIQVASERDLPFDIGLRRSPVLMPQMVVRTGGARALPTDSLGARRTGEVGELTNRSLESGSGLADLALSERALGSLPNDPAGEEDVLLLRGSSADLKLVLLDGAPVYAPFHVGGLLDPFNSSILGESAVYVGGAPARYDGGLSYIMDVRTRRPEPDRIRTSGSVDLIGAQGVLEGPIGGSTSFVVGGRGLHDIDTGLFGPEDTPVGYQDAIARIDHDVGEGRRLGTTMFWNRETVLLSGVESETTGDPIPRGEAEWGNAAISATFESEGEDTHSKLTAAVSRYFAAIPGNGTDASLLEGVTRRTRVTWDVDRNMLAGQFEYGAVLDHTGVDYATRVGESETLVPVGGSGLVFGGYLEGGWTLGEAVHFRSGLRMDHFTEESETKFAPRATLTMLFSERSTLTIATGTYNQYSRALEERAGTPVEGSPEDEPSALEVPLLPVASATHLVVSFDQELPGDVTLGLRTFRKSFRGTSGVEGDRFRSSGFEVGAHREGAVVSGWVDYSVSWFWAQVGRAPRGRTFPSRHLLNAGVSGRLQERGGIDFQFAFGSGLPFTAIPFGSETTADLPAVGGALVSDDVRVTRAQLARMTGDEGPSPEVELRETLEFFRIDARVYGVITSTVGGRAVEIRPYVKVLNALDDRDALFYLSQISQEGPRPIAELSFLPIVGVEWRF